MSERLTDAEAQEMLAKLEAHFGERVTTPRMYCAALHEWFRVMRESGYAPQVADAWDSIHLTLYKSNLAWRLVILGEQLRSEPCPIHKGHWSGCKFFGEGCPHCMSGSNVTGWCAPETGAKDDPNAPLRGVIAVPMEPA